MEWDFVSNYHAVIRLRDPSFSIIEKMFYHCTKSVESLKYHKYICVRVFSEVSTLAFITACIDSWMCIRATDCT